MCQDRLLFGGDSEVDGGSVPWEFHTSAACDPKLYGYRGCMLDWDYFAQVGSTETLNSIIEN